MATFLLCDRVLLLLCLFLFLRRQLADSCTSYRIIVCFVCMYFAGVSSCSYKGNRNVVLGHLPNSLIFLNHLSKGPVSQMQSYSEVLGLAASAYKLDQETQFSPYQEDRNQKSCERKIGNFIKRCNL